MASTIFYSWQSDTPSNTNRTFIKDAIERAIKRVVQDINVEEPTREEPFQLDQDTQGIPGSPEIANTILQKIDACGIFVPDLTCVARTEKGRRVPNPNVLIELGYAMKSMESTRIVSVMNEAFGKAEDGLPFDLAHRRWPIRYTLPVDAVPETRRQVRDDLITKLTVAFRTILESGALHTEIQQPVFQEITPVWRSSSFLQDGELLAHYIPRGLHALASDIFWHNAPQAFLRLIPTTLVPERTPQQLLLLINESPLLCPFGRVQSFSTERNRYGAVSFDAKETPQSSADCISQVFKNGELWGISKWALGGTRRQEVIPSMSIEDEFERIMVNYLQFAQDKLQLALPIKFVAGLSAVQGFVMALPDCYGGHIVEDEIVYQGFIDNYATHVQVYLRPFFERIWDACGLERPAKFREPKRG